MSAFVITRRTMDVVITALQDTNARSSRRLFAGHVITPDSTSLDAVGRTLWDLNVRAVAGRYPGLDGQVAQGADMVLTYRWTGVYWPSATRQQVRCRYAKAVACLVYQCSEDATINDPLLAELREVRSDLSDEIVSDLRDYADAPWDFEEKDIPRVVRLI